VRRRDRYERDPAAFIEQWRAQDDKLRRRLVAARKRLPDVEVEDTVLENAARLCMALGTDGLRGELTLLRAARALAALDGESTVGITQLRAIAPSALRHRLRRNPLDDSVASVRVDRAVAELFGT
jgi:magnesium chelatase subunit I